MSIVIQGQNTSNNGDAEYLFEPTNQQINNLNTLCYGRMDTPIKNVQFNFKCNHQNLFEDCYIDLQIFNLFQYNSSVFGVQLGDIKHITFDKSYDSISQFYNQLQESTKTITISTNFTFEQGLTFDQDLLQQGICNFCFYAQCIESKDPEWPVDRVNMDTGYSHIKTADYIKVMSIHGENLLKMLGMQYIQESFKKYMRPYFDYRVSKTIDPLIRVTYEDGTTNLQGGIQDGSLGGTPKKIIQYDFYYYSSAIYQNLLCMCPVWQAWGDNYEIRTQEITRQGVTYTVSGHQDWMNCFYIEGIKYNPAQWINRQTNVAIDVNTLFSDELDKFYFYAAEPYRLFVYHYLLFDSPELAYANYADAQGGIYNIISKTVNNTNPNQYFTMTTTEPLKKLTLQNLANLKIQLKIYDERFSLLKAFQQPLLIITMDRQKQDEKELKDLRKTVDATSLLVQSQNEV